MSIQAMAWAIEQQEVSDPVTRLVLICLANYANADGKSAFPSVDTLFERHRLFYARGAVQYQLKKLIKQMMIRRGNQSVTAAHIERSDRRPRCYDLLISRGAPHAPRSVTGCTSAQNGVHGEASRGAPHAPDPSESVREPKSAESDYREEFRRRFGHYPDALAKPPAPKRVRR